MSFERSNRRTRTRTKDDDEDERGSLLSCVFPDREKPPCGELGPSEGSGPRYGDNPFFRRPLSRRRRHFFPGLGAECLVARSSHHATHGAHYSHGTPRKWLFCRGGRWHFSGRALFLSAKRKA